MNNVDLFFSSVAFPSEGLLGMPISLLWTVTNQGTSSTSSAYSWYDTVYLSEDETLDPSDIYIATGWINNGPLAPNSSYTSSASGSLQGVNPGIRYLIFKTDTFNYLTESNKSNNIYVAPILVTAPNVDLVIDSATVPIDAALGDTITVSWTGKNIGSETASFLGRYDEVYLSDDATFDSSDTYLGSQWFYDPLESDASYSQNLAVSISNNSKAGSRYLILVANSGRLQGETNFLNNTYAAPINILAPDLTVSDAIAPTIVNTGESITVTWTIRNQGAATALSYRSDKVYFSKDDNTPWQYLGELPVTANLQAGESATVSTDILLSSYIGSGSGHLLFITDDLGQQGESDETNNFFAVPITINAPDLRVTGASAPNNAALGQTIDVSWTVTNQGNGSALGYPIYGGGYGVTAALASASFAEVSATPQPVSATTSYQPWYDGVYLSNDDQWDNSDTYVGSQSAPALLPLDPNGSYTATQSITLPTSTNGAKYILFVADSFQRQDEADETNNAFALPIALSGPDLVVSDATSPTQGSLGNSFAVSWTVTNQGDTGTLASYWYDTVYISSDPYLDYTDTFVTNSFVNRQLNQDGSYTINQNISLPSTEIGDRHLIFATDNYRSSYNSYYDYYYDNRQGEINEANNFRAIPIHLTAADIFVSGVSTSSFATLGETLNVSWTVTNQGSATASADWWDAIYLSDDPYLDTSSYNYNDIYLGGAFAGNKTPLSAGDSYTLDANIRIADVLPGSKYLIFAGDSNRAQAESNENNNYYAIPIALTASDLTVSATSAPATAAIGDSVEVSWTVNNQGITNALNQWDDGVYISDDTTLDWTDRLLSSESISVQAPLAAGASYTITKNILLPNTSTGNRYLLFAADRLGNLRETNENNNVKAVQIALTPSQADLAVAVTASAPATAAYGDEILLSWIVTNQGTTTASATWTNAVYLSNDAVFDANDRLLRSQSSSSALAAGAQAAVSQSVLIPNGTTIGAQYLLIVADPNNQQAESDEINNVQSLSISVVAPDLTVEAIIIPVSGQFGQSINISWTVKNIGTSTAKSGWADTIWLVKDGTPDYEEVLLLRQTITDALEPGAEYIRNESVSLPLSPLLNEGDYRIVVKTDNYWPYSSSQQESNENNNLKASDVLSLTLPPLPDLVATKITAPVEGLSGQQIEIAWTITNQGNADAMGTWSDNIYLSKLANIGQERYFETFPFVGIIKAGESITRRQVVTLPNDLEGNYWFTVQTDAGKNLYEHTSENNNSAITAQPINVLLSPFPNLQVSSVMAPPKAFSSKEIAVEWTVTNTGNGSTSALSWEDSVWLSLDNAYDSSDILLGKVPNASYLNPGESYTSQLKAILPQNETGKYYVLVQTDSRKKNQWGDVYELNNELDNVGSSGIVNIELTPPPDLKILNVTALSQTFSGQSVSLSWIVINQGETISDGYGWVDTVYMSTDRGIDGDDIFLGQVFHGGGLGAEQSYSVTQNFALPVGITGDFYFVVKTDAVDVIYENAFNANNITSTPNKTKVNLTPPPDLEVEFANAPSTALASHGLNLSYRVVNFGATATPNSYWEDAFYLSTDNQLDTTDIYLGKAGHQGALDIEQGYDKTVALRLPDGLVGSYYVLIASDSSNTVFELNNANNVGFAIQPTILDSRPADLIVSAMNVPTLDAGKTVSVSWTVTNQGIGDTAVTVWTDRLVASVDGILGNNDDVILGTFIGKGLLNAGASYTQTQQIVVPLSLEGAYTLFVTTDVDKNVYEASQEANNTASQTVAISRQTPDLQISQVNTSATAISSQNLTVNWTVQNLGTVRTNSSFWYDNVYLSNDRILNKGDILLGQTYHNGALDAQGQYTASGTFEVPIDVAGDWYVIAKADGANEFDVANRVYEGALEGNNTLVSINPVAVTLGEVPDLQVIQVDAPTEGISGQAVQVSWTVRNAGANTRVQSWTDAVYLSRDQFFDPGVDAFLGYVDRVGALAAGQSYTQTHSSEIPQGLSGPFYVFAVTDSKNKVYERTQELNNAAYDGNSMQVSLPAPVDLVAGNITVPVNGIPGQQISLTYTVQNQGVNQAKGSWVDSVYISADDKWDINDKLVGRVRHTGDVASGASYTETLNAELPGVLPGDYHAIVRSDIRNNIAESNEANNLSVSLDKVTTDAQLLQLGMPVTGTLGQGQAVYYRVDVQAGQTLRLSLDSSSITAANELYVRYGDMPSQSQFDFTVSQPLNTDQEVLVPTTQAGTYYVMARGGGVVGAAAGFDLKAEVLPFGVTGLSVQKGGNNGQVTMAIDGSLFDRNTTVELVGNGATIKPAWYKYVDATKIIATFDLTGKAIGQYDIHAFSKEDTVEIDPQTGSAYKATIVHGDVTLSNAFDVVQGGSSGLTAAFSMPRVGLGTSFTFYLDVVNEGNTDVSVPSYEISSLNEIPFSVTRNGQLSDQEQVFVLGGKLRSQFLAPGESVRIPLYGVATKEVTAEFTLKNLSAPGSTIDWDAYESAYRSLSVDANWGQTWSNYKSLVGNSWDSLHKVIELVAPSLASSSDDHAVSGTELVLDLLSRARQGQNDASVLQPINLDLAQQIALLMDQEIAFYNNWIQTHPNSELNLQANTYTSPAISTFQSNDLSSTLQRAFSQIPNPQPNPEPLII
jgi:subtilase family serine protease